MVGGSPEDLHMLLSSLPGRRCPPPPLCWHNRALCVASRPCDRKRRPWSETPGDDSSWWNAWWEQHAAPSLSLRSYPAAGGSTGEVAGAALPFTETAYASQTCSLDLRGVPTRFVTSGCFSSPMPLAAAWRRNHAAHRHSDSHRCVPLPPDGQRTSAKYPGSHRCAGCLFRGRARVCGTLA